MARRLALILSAVVITGELTNVCFAQSPMLPYLQNFDSPSPPALPAGWSATQNRTPGTNDFATSTTTPRSSPNAVGSTNATISQSLFSPLFDFSNLMPDTLGFYVRRSGTHNAKVLVEASLDSGVTYSLRLSDSLTNTLPNSYVQVKLKLPSVLSTSTRVRFRWRVVADTAGSTGTLRIDDVTITALQAIDLALAAIRFQSPLPIEGDSVVPFAKIKNVGQQSVQNFAVEFYVDANNDSLPQAPELRASVNANTALSPGDSIELSASLGNFLPGSQYVMAKLVSPPDQNLSNNLRGASLTIGYRAHSIVVNEIMYAPTGTEPEWVELYNTRTDAINIKNWFVSDNLVSTKRLVTAQNTLVGPNEFVVLTRDSAALVDIHPTITSRIVNVASFPSLNNTGDAVVIYDQRAATMDSVSYQPSWGGSANGFSLERIDPRASSVTSGNWGSARNIARSTPGERNSLARKDRDLVVDSINVSPALITVGEIAQLAVRVKNPGRDAAMQFTVQLFEDANNDSLPQPAELLQSQVRSTPLEPLDSAQVLFTVNFARAGQPLLIARVSFPLDEDSTNNTRLRQVVIGYPVGTVRINEIMYAPSTGVPEWIELFNARSDTIDLSKWLVGNRSLSSRYEVSNRRILLAPDELIVLAKDTALLRAAYPTLASVVQVPSLPTFLWSNNGDAVVVVDNRRVVMDSVFYRPTWGGVNGKSLERIDPLTAANDSLNWASSIDSTGATPGRRNSQVQLDSDLRLVRISSETVTAGSSARVSCVLQNVGKLPVNQFDVKIFDDVDGDSVGAMNELITERTIAQTLAPRESTVVLLEWQSPSSGVHRTIGQVYAPGDQRGANDKAFTTLRVGFPSGALLINEIMFAPLSDRAEYIELYNASQTDVDLAQWTIHDRATTTSVNEFKLATKSKLLRLGEFFVLASDSGVLHQFAPFDERFRTIVNKASLGLNNDEDDLVLVDPSGEVVDSVSYSSSWHNTNITDKSGRSLEKINPLLASELARNWTTCVLSVGGTPGRMNSVFSATLPSQAKLVVSPNPFSPDGDGREDFAIIQYELPLAVSMIRVRIYDAVGRRIRTLANNEPSGSRGNIVWDGNDDDNQKARIGAYVVFVEALNDGGGIVETAKAVVVLAARL